MGRERGDYGVGFGGISVGGLVNNRRVFSQLPGTLHLRHTHDLARNVLSEGPPHGAELADDLQRLVDLHGAETIAAVIVEQISESAGVLLPQAYLTRLRKIATRHGILLIFDEVITGFGRLGASFAAELFGITPDIMTTAKGLTNGAVPMGAVFVSRSVHDALMQGPMASSSFTDISILDTPWRALPPWRPSTSIGRRSCSYGWPSWRRYGRRHARHFGHDLTSLTFERSAWWPGSSCPAAPRRSAPVRSNFLPAATTGGLLVRYTGETIALSPPLIVELHQIGAMVAIIGDVLEQIA